MSEAVGVGVALAVGLGVVGVGVGAAAATKMVTLLPVGAVPPLGFCSNTLPGVDPAGPCTVLVTTLNPAPDRICCAVAIGSPITDGT